MGGGERECCVDRNGVTCLGHAQEAVEHDEFETEFFFQNARVREEDSYLFP